MQKGFSIHIGVNKVSPKNKNQAKHLRACVNDAKAMEKIAISKGFQSSLLINQEATSKKLYVKINQYVNLLTKGDILFLSFSGHGGSTKDWSDDEADGKDETWCLYDRSFLDDELYRLLCKIPEGVRVLVVSDSCHSGTVIKDSTNIFSSSIFNAHQSNRKNNNGLKASVRLLSGCQDNEYSREKGIHGVFTKALLDVWDEGKFRGDYKKFHRSILRRVPFRQKPNHLIIGPPNSKFNKEPPFSI